MAEPRRLLFLGRISPEKGVHVLLDAFEQLVAEGRDLELKLVGEEAVVPFEMLVGLADSPRVRDLEQFYSRSYVDALRERVAPTTLERIEFVGPVPYETVTEHYRAADVFVMPSLMEAFGMPLAEALGAGLPAVAGRTGGMVDVVEHGRSGLLVEPGDASALTTALRAVLDDGDLRQELADAGRARARERFDWDSVAAAAEREMLSVSGRGRPPAGRQRSSAPASQAAP